MTLIFCLFQTPAGLKSRDKNFREIFLPSGAIFRPIEKAAICVAAATQPTSCAACVESLDTCVESLETGAQAHALNLWSRMR